MKETIPESSLSLLRCRILKRVFDVLFSVLVLLFVYPWIYIVVGCLIKVKMPGKIIFKQKRTGLKGKEFVCYKFRSMIPHSESDDIQCMDDDPRITPLGHFLRSTSIDEFPQFWNVLKGDMSVVGPRPHMLAHTAYYEPIIPGYSKRLTVKPGITGWAQVHNLRGETEKADKMAKRVEYDIWYIKHWSFGLDLKIIGRTLSVFFR